MRMLTTVADQAEAKTLGDALYADGVATTIKGNARQHVCGLGS